MSNFLFVVVAFGFFLLQFFRFEGTARQVETTLFSWLLIAFLLLDLRTWRIPRELAICSLIVAFVFGFLDGAIPTLADRVFGAVSGFVFLQCILVSATWLLRRTDRLGPDQFALGAGDPWLLAVLGGFLGYVKLPTLIFWGCLQGVAAFVLLRSASSQTLCPPWPVQGAAMPLGAFLSLAGLELIIWTSFWG